MWCVGHGTDPLLVALAVALLVLLWWCFCAQPTKVGFEVSPRARRIAKQAKGYFDSTENISYAAYRRKVADSDPAQFDRLRALHKKNGLTPEAVQRVIDRRAGA